MEEERARAEATRKAVKKVKVEQQVSKKAQVEDPDPKPKRPMSAWFLYLNSVRSGLMRANPELDICAVTTLAAQGWREMDSEERAEFDDQAKELRQAYDVEMKGYRKRHKPKKSEKKRKGRIDILVDQYFLEISKRKKPEEKKTEPKNRKRSKLSPHNTNLPVKKALSETRIKELEKQVESLALLMPDHNLVVFEICLAPPKDEDVPWAVDDMIETMQCMAHDYPALSSACEQAKDAKENFDMNSMSNSVELFNATMMFVNPAKGDGIVPVPTPPNAAQTLHLQNLVYHRVVKNPQALNKYQGFSDEVYGEAQHPLISELIQTVPIAKDMVFIDLGSGIGQVVMQVAAQAQCKMSHGIELSDLPAQYAQAMESEFRSVTKQYGKCHGDFSLIQGNFLDPETLSAQMLGEADVIFVNNVAFGAETNQQLLERFTALKEGTKIISMRSFATQVGGRGRLLNTGVHAGEGAFKFRCSCGLTGVSHYSRDLVDCIQCGVWQHRRCAGVSTDEECSQFLCKQCHRYMEKQVSMKDGMSMDVLGPFYSKAQNAVSWTSAPVSYFIHTIGRKSTEVAKPACATEY
eukprot:TRINITY_DN24406_c0_g1_i2.p1 TRINITY_DN24406_c0_g1~~TRINITY_DN24406_c0_g1_i2.p1  ORF type:complete len:578 (-),score=168.19 TRINITY_DN24406_c0_g1_i2:152-1885(-)